jgi:acyl-CoA synthetase
MFSSFAIKEMCNNDFHIFYGSSDCGVYCLNNNGEQVWETHLEGRITSTPFIFQCKLNEEIKEDLLVICNAPNCLTVINSNTGKIIIVNKMPKETFSSPVVIENFVVLGCRDDYVYCFKLIKSSN